MQKSLPARFFHTGERGSCAHIILCIFRNPPRPVDLIIMATLVEIWNVDKDHSSGRKLGKFPNWSDFDTVSVREPKFIIRGVYLNRSKRSILLGWCCEFDCWKNTGIFREKSIKAWPNYTLPLVDVCPIGGVIFMLMDHWFFLWSSIWLLNNGVFQHSWPWLPRMMMLFVWHLITILEIILVWAFSYLLNTFCDYWMYK